MNGWMDKQKDEWMDGYYKYNIYINNCFCYNNGYVMYTGCY